MKGEEIVKWKLSFSINTKQLPNNWMRSGSVTTEMANKNLYENKPSDDIPLGHIQEKQ